MCICASHASNANTNRGVRAFPLTRQQNHLTQSHLPVSRLECSVAKRSGARLGLNGITTHYTLAAHAGARHLQDCVQWEGPGLSSSPEGLAAALRPVMPSAAPATAAAAAAAAGAHRPLDLGSLVRRGEVWGVCVGIGGGGAGHGGWVCGVGWVGGWCRSGGGSRVRVCDGASGGGSRVRGCLVVRVTQFAECTQCQCCECVCDSGSNSCPARARAPVPPPPAPACCHVAACAVCRR